jgi:DNA-3-methyladenine glycosylase II
VLGLDQDLSEFNAAASQIAWLRPLVDRMAGVRPPRYPTLWEACVNAILFQQVSIQSASAIMQRFVVALGTPVSARMTEDDAHATEYPTLITFPGADTVAGATDELLRSVGLTTARIATLRRVGAAIAAGALDEHELETASSEVAALELRRIKGIGPWTAAVILLRGLGRLDVFPGNDSSIVKNLAICGGGDATQLPAVLDRLGAQRGMLYFQLLLARLEQSGDLLRPSLPPLPDPELAGW